MNCLFKFLYPIVALLVLQSCDKAHTEDEVIIDYFTYGTKFNFREDSIKTDNGDWTKIENGNVFAWLADSTILKRTDSFAKYDDSDNLKADFIYTIKEDSVFSFRLSPDDTIYFLDENGNHRTDITGRISFSQDTSLILHNTGVSPRISIKYRLER